VERQLAHRVRCPTCGAWAQLRLAYRDDGRPPVPVAFSCVNQTSSSHAPPTREQIMELVAAVPPPIPDDL
jgi:hypothetical protein